MNRLLAFVLVSAWCAMQQSCRDDLLYDDSELRDGMVLLQGTFSFVPLVAVENDHTRAQTNMSGTVAPNAEKLLGLNKLTLLFYDGNGQLIPDISGPVVFTSKMTSRPAGTNGDDPLAESQTPSATFTKQIPSGFYYIFAVANMDISLADVPDKEALRSLKISWVANNISSNLEMLGVFTRGDATAAKNVGFEEDVLLKLSPGPVALHSWARRAVSKITIDFDGSQLRNNVSVYIQRATVKHIAEGCYLGRTSKAGEGPDEFGLAESSHRLVYGAGDDFRYWPRVDISNNLKTYNDADGRERDLHDEYAFSLPCYENMQGTGQSKLQDANGDGIVDNPNGNTPSSPGYQDGKPYATYIEVEGYYVNDNTNSLSSGPITFRFNIGKNITDDYNLERNHHYKVTMALKGNGNDVDWHIVYADKIPTVTAHSAKVSYLYGQEKSYAVKFVFEDPKQLDDYILKAEIIENNWWPSTPEDPEKPGVYELAPATVGDMDNPYGFAWFRSTVADGGYYSKADNSKFAGFLALQKPETDANGVMKDLFPDMGFSENSNSALRNYYNSNHVGEAAYRLTLGAHNVGYWNGKEYVQGNRFSGQYTVMKTDDHSVTVNVPMWTRPLKMVTTSDFTGNNPFVRFERRAKVKYTIINTKTGAQLDFYDNETGNLVKERVVDMVQERRIENPKVIYRSHDNTEAFQVKLMYNKYNVQTNTEAAYEQVKSVGPWRASILACTEDFVKLTDSKGRVVTSRGAYISGDGGTFVDFKYEPAGPISADKTRCAIILVEYHDYKCNHMIFVRQGYHAGVNLAGTNWSCYQVYAAGLEGVSHTDYTPGKSVAAANVILTKNPLSMGSYLRRCQYNAAIREMNNDDALLTWLMPMRYSSKNEAGATVYLSRKVSAAYIDASSKTAKNKTLEFKSIMGYGWYNYGKTTQRFTETWAKTWTAVGGWQDGKTFRVPTAQNFKNLMAQCDFGFGVAYADGATEVADTYADAYEFIDKSNSGSRSPKGVRVCVSYDRISGKNVLFPLGKSGFARRSRTVSKSGNGKASLSGGGLSYGGLTGVLSASNTLYRPLTYNHHRSPGGCYWIHQPVTKKNGSNITVPDYAAWDINYFTTVFNHYDRGTLGPNINQNAPTTSDIIASDTSDIYYTCSDALPIKLVYK